MNPAVTMLLIGDIAVAGDGRGEKYGPISHQSPLRSSQ
jgi:hypothetical protein